MGRQPTIFHILDGKKYTISELAAKLGKTPYKAKKWLEENNASKGIETDQEEAERLVEKEALEECMDSQMDLLGDLKNGVRDFGLSGFYALAKRVEGLDFVYDLNLKDAIGFSLKYFMAYKEFKYLREELSLELDKALMYENERLLFKIGSIDFEVEKVSSKIAKKMRKLNESSGTKAKY